VTGLLALWLVVGDGYVGIPGLAALNSTGSGLTGVKADEGGDWFGDG
jgi:hypothetical protein